MFEQHLNQHRRIIRPLGLAAAATMTLAVIGIAPATAAPATTPATVANGVLTVLGTPRPDSVTVDFSATDPVGVEVDGVRQGFGLGTVRSVSVVLGSGDDTFRVLSGGSAATDLPLTVFAGTGDDAVTGGAGVDAISGDDGNDRLLGGAGNDVLVGGRGDDFVNGQVGTDTELLGSGDDTAGWLPGEGSDLVFGGSGRDTLAFTGAGGDEVMSLTANGGRALFLRSPGSVRMDLADVERLDLDTLGGVDSVSVGDLTGTDIDEATIDLSANGAGDGKDDSVTVNGTEHADRIAVAADSGAVEVEGLLPRIRIDGAEPTDHLDVNARGGDDRVDVSDAARALIDVLVDLGL
jgi:Ca2+-binding RTX toxin-like protein